MADAARAKDALRSRMKAIRASLSLDARAQASAAAAERCLAFLEAELKNKTVALFAAFGSEADPIALEAVLTKQGHRIVYPRVNADTLSFHETVRSALHPTPPWGVPEPSPNQALVPLCDIDIFIVPGLAFTRAGARLGYGRGYYDRILQKTRPTVLAVGFGFACQLVHDLPESAHDQRLGAVATENGVSSECAN